MLAKIDRKTAALATGSVVVIVACVVFIVWMVGNIIEFHKDYDSTHKVDKVVTETHLDPVDDHAGTYGPTMKTNGKIGMGYDLGNGLVLSPSGGLSLGLGF